jgi:O-antigen ligase/tetratricopeptide (TPR) repeat protein
MNSFGAAPARGWSWDEILLKVCDAALAGVIFVAPLFLGGRHPVGKFVYVVFVCIAGAAYCARQCVLSEAPWRMSGAEWLILAAALLLIFQLAPMPPSLLERASPGLRELLPLWQADSDSPGRVGVWRTLSLAPRETRAGLVMFLAHAMLFITVVQRLTARADIERLLTWIALACAGMAALGLLQYFFGNGKFLWVYMHPSRDTTSAVKGSFHNQNHFAQFLALGIGPLIWLVRRRLEEQQQAAMSRGQARQHHSVAQRNWRQRAPLLFLIASLVAVGFAGLLTFSRGGVLALFLATALCVCIYAWKQLLGPRSFAALGFIGLAATVAILSYGYEPLMRRLSSFQESQTLSELCHGRAVLWSAMLQAVPNHPVFGSGVGSHMEVYPTYFEEYAEREFTHGENGYLQVLLETGVVGLTLLVAGIGLGVGWCVWSIHRGDSAMIACAAPVLGGLAASAVHSCGDFVWYIPGCMSVTVLLLACACRLCQMTRPANDEEVASPCYPRVIWVGAAAVLIGLSAGMVRDRLPPALAAPHWDRYIALSLRASGKSHWASTAERLPTDNAPLNERLRGHLKAALDRDPNNARANLRMAVISLRMFEIRQQSSANAMGLMQVRDAALASNFASREDQERWLNAALGENRPLLDQAIFHLRRALALCPLQGNAYLYLAETAFLDGLGPHAKRDYVEQAVRLRPFEGPVLMAAGQEAAQDGDLNRALGYWKQAFGRDPNTQHDVVELLAQGLPAEALLEALQPDWTRIGVIYRRYQYLNRREDAVFAGRRFIKLLKDEALKQSGDSACSLWSEVASAYDYLDEPENALTAIELAMRAAPGNFSARRAHAFYLLEANRYDHAVKELEWCLRHDPNDNSARVGLKRALSEQASHVSRQAAGPTPTPK